jgi:hypothetical protein
MLFAVSGQEAHFAAAEVAVMLDLEHRSELNDEWMACFSASQWPTTNIRDARAQRAAEPDGRRGGTGDSKPL